METLAKEPNSLLYAMATGRVYCPKDSKGRLFIDRNARCFTAIIDYLRSGLYDKNSDNFFLGMLYVEARHFGISSLIKGLGGVKLDSVLNLNPEEIKVLTEWCKAESFTLLYRASRDGFKSVNFHEKM